MTHGRGIAQGHCEGVVRQDSRSMDRREGGDAVPRRARPPAFRTGNACCGKWAEGSHGVDGCNANGLRTRRPLLAVAPELAQGSYQPEMAAWAYTMREFEMFQVARRLKVLTRLTGVGPPPACQCRRGVIARTRCAGCYTEAKANLQ